jgi:N-acetyl-D-muramate 6-phosphate phosphatase
MISAVLFDLDGTLVDTAPDLAYALNLQRQKHGLDFLPESTIRPFASHGSKGLLEIGFNLTPENLEFDSMRAEYLALYEDVFTRSPELFTGMNQVLQTLKCSQIPWGVVTNKPKRFTEPLLASMGLDNSASVVVSGDEAAQPKPSPLTLLMACERLKVNPLDCIYVGDAERDIIAGNAAGMKTAVALFGYIDKSDKPHEWGADVLINTPQEILALLN